MDTKFRREKEEKEIKQLLEGYKLSLEAKGIKTISEYLRDVSEYLEYTLERELDPCMLPAGFGDEYRSHLIHREPPLSRGTINNKLNRVRSFYKHLSKKGMLLCDPFEDTKGLSGLVSIPKNILSIEQAGLLLDNFAIKKEDDYIYQLLAELLYGSALRISEAAALKLGDLDTEAKALNVWDFKNDKPRTVPSSEVFIKKLKDYCRSSRTNLLTPSELSAGFIFPQRGSTTLRVNLNRKLESECKRLALPVITSHSLRHCAATHMLKKGAGIRQVQAMLGHEKISTTQIYTRVLTDDLKNLVSQFHPREAAV